MRHQRFAAKNIRGFGLMQRDRDFASYQDIFNFYHLVPSVWIEPRGSHWGEGDLHLVELSTHYEGLDNIVAFWEPKVKPQPLEPLRFAYTMHWTHDDQKFSSNRVVATRIGVDPRDSKRRQIVIDFAGPKLSALPAGAPPEAIASCSDNGTITETLVFPIPSTNIWRAIVKLEPKAGNVDPIDIRCTLKKGEEVLTETWTYHWSPP
jgi:glucans biosynthesis protein